MKIVISSDLMGSKLDSTANVTLPPTYLLTYLPKYPPAFISKCLANYLP